MAPKKMDEGRLTELEKRMHAAAISAPEHTVTGEELSAGLGDVPIEEQLLAINSLLKKSLFNAQKGPSGIQYVAVSTGEASVLGSMDGNELIIYNYIKDARNEGIWTKMIKARTNLHQTILNRCLKLLEQKQLVKAVKSVKFPTRKIYMLYDLTPSIELSGGPWYADNELDTGFIHELSLACLRYIQSQTWPKDGRSSALYPASHTADLPTAANVHRYLKDARLTDTELEQEHVVALLDLLIYDNKIEKIPVLPALATRRARNDITDRSSEESGSDAPTNTLRGSSRLRKRVRLAQVQSCLDGTDTDTDSANGSSGSVHGRGRKEPRHNHTEGSKNTRHQEMEDVSVTNLTHVPYVYRAVKPLLQPHGGESTGYIPLNVPWLQTPTGVDDVDDATLSIEMFFGTKQEGNAISATTKAENNTVIGL
ncbi:34-kDa subunit of RNA polymerase III (C) [Malassezia vespertilionis]|uniref:34-kDa subunit of RNA polymerase III (C) n=1 Tax=Malassezia vespertilionis TaxID=2020962 RepID=UPI0024B22497|nr:34-kDa subunit of RNA polymerase III (C) [Malassezia vespertilionis]WFD07306.1 34-kDa subunit of RNA polymerase III (C) [Malassezia vespertilionis]